MTDGDWEYLIDQITDGACTPFLGAGASWPYVDTGTAIARRWAAEERFPLRDNDNLPLVAQFIALDPDSKLETPTKPKKKMTAYLKTCRTPNYQHPDDVHGILAGLPLKLFITTNYDSFLVDALKAKGKTPRREFCRWNKGLQDEKKYPRASMTDLTVGSPLVYHLHGHNEFPESLVLTEDDYVDFIVNMSQRPDVIPATVLDALVDTTLIFLGYSLMDWNFRVLFRSVQTYLQSSVREGHVTVQLEPDIEAQAGPDFPARAVRFFEKYFKNQRIGVFWGKCDAFLHELRDHRELVKS